METSDERARAQAVVRVPASISQEALWRLQVAGSADGRHCFQATLAFDGMLAVPALEQSLRELIRRHAIFRTTFTSVDGQLVQQVVDDWTVHLDFVDLVANPDAESKLASVTRDMVAIPFDTGMLPLVRWTLVRLASDRHVLVQVAHRLIFDRWSFNVYLDELIALYRARVTDQDLSLRPWPADFGQLAARQRAAERSGAFSAQLANWQRRLAGAPPSLRLVTDRPRLPSQTDDDASIFADLPQTLCSELRALAQDARCTYFATVCAAFVTLLHRYTDETDICVGTELAAHVAMTERAIGRTANTVALRTDVSDDPTFRELLARLGATVAEAADNRDVPFDRVVDAVRPELDPAIHPLFSVMFDLHDGADVDLAVPGVKVSLVQLVERGAGAVDLHLVGISRPDGMTLHWQFNRHLFEAGSIERMAGHFHRLLESIAAQPECRISRLPMMDPAERDKVLSLRGQCVPYERDAAIQDVFAGLAALTPEAVAVQGNGFALTYAELDARSNRLANHLRALGVVPECPVGLCMGRTADLPVAIFGILKAGGAYVPLDPDYPVERLDLMLRDARVLHIVTDRSRTARLPVAGRTLILVDEGAAAIAACSSASPGVQVDGDGLAYVIYTSGSTGAPKGVAVTHRGVVRLVRGADYLEIAPEDVFLQFAPLSFDASTFEIFAPLLNGAKLVLAPAGPVSLAELARTIVEHGVTTMWLTAPLFHRMVESEVECFRGVRHLLVGGDVVSPEHARRFRLAVPTCALTDGYGPTENTTFSCCYQVPSAEEIGARLPIGRPIANSTAYILDRHLEPVPIGVPGELCVGGDGVARGYLNAAELTAQRFVRDPFVDEDGARLYRTGDRARFYPDGTIDFLGRIDQQVKIRGFRIELGEIECALRAHRALREAAAAVAEREGDRSLVAYVVPAHGSAVNAEDVRAFLETRLPRYMIPQQIFVVADIPSNASGKLDRRTLATTRHGPPPITGAGRACSPTESKLAAIVGELLGGAAVEPSDDLFDLGVHSLLAMRIVARIETAFGISLPLRVFFDSPTVAGLAAFVDAAARGPHDDREGTAAAPGR